MVSDEKLAERLRDILRSSDLDTTTPGSVRRQLEADFGVDLSDRKAFIRDQIDLFLASHMANPQEEEEEEVEEEDGKEAEAEEEEKDDEDDSGGRGRGKGRSNKEDKVKKRGGFNKLCSLSPHLQEVVGEAEMSRPEVVKKLWSYIRENDLQDPKNKRNIICDESLQALFRVNTINMFQMNKSLSKHIWPLSTEDENVRQKKKAEESDHSESEEESNKAQKQEEDEEEDEKDSRRRKRKGRSAKVDKDVKKRGGGGFAKVCSLSPQLQAFIGEAELARTEVVKKLWSYIKENDLQDPKNKQNIICDESLRALFHVDRINMFQMNKALAKHIWPLNADNAVRENSSQKEEQSKQEQEEEEEEEEEDKEEEEDSDEPKKKEKRQKKGGSGFTAPLPLSDALVKFIGTGENTLSRADVVKRMWQYIKQNDLQDPSDKRRILCDDKLKELFDVDSFNGFSVTKLLTAHFVKTE